MHAWISFFRRGSLVPAKARAKGVEERIYAMGKRLVADNASPSMLRDYMRMVILPLQAEALLQWAQGNGKTLPTSLRSWLPAQVSQLLSDMGKMPLATGTEEKVDLAEVPAISFPWDEWRMQNALRIGSWRYDRLNHGAYLYSPIGVVLFYNGLHSGAVGVLRRDGVLSAYKVDMSIAYEAGLKVDWTAGVPVACLGRVRAPFDHPTYGLLWALGHLFWQEGIRL